MAPFRYLALGDSYTIGEAVPTANSFPAQLLRLLDPSGSATSPHILAKTGWTTDELMAAIDQDRPAGPFDLVTLLIGVNNQYRGYPFSQYQAEYGALLQLAIQFAGSPGKVIGVAIPDYGSTPFGAEKAAQIGQELRLYNQEAFQQCQKAGVAWVDIFPISQNPENFPGWLAEDQLHPSALQYESWAGVIYPTARRIVFEKG